MTDELIGLAHQIQGLCRVGQLPDPALYYDPRFDRLEELCDTGDYAGAQEIAARIKNDNVAASYIGYEMVKIKAIEAGESRWEEEAADAAAEVLKQLWAPSFVAKGGPTCRCTNAGNREQ